MKTIRATVDDRLALSKKLISSAHETDAKGSYLLSLEERDVITNACFLRMFVALEEFLESAFLHYAVGRMSTARWRPSKYIRATDTEHAQRMLIGTQRFVDWSTPDTVRKLARLYFEHGDPFETPVASANQHLLDMKTVRNSTAHLSRTTQTSLDALRSRWTSVPSVNSTSYEVLLSSRAGSQDSFLTVSETTISAIVMGVADRS